MSGSPDEAPLMDPRRSRVLLIGASRFVPGSGLPDLPAVPKGIAELRRLLTDPDRGGLQTGVCRSIIDPMNILEVDDAFGRCVEEAEHTLLVYYSGHGLPDPHDGSLYLAVTGTNPRRPHTTAVPIEWIRRGMRETSATTKVVILDCCYAGRAIGIMSASALAAQVSIAGSYVIVATPANKHAVAPEGEPYTAFTGALVDVLRDGVPGGPDCLDLDSIFNRVRTNLVRRSLPAPEVQRSNDAAHLALVRNGASQRRQRHDGSPDAVALRRGRPWRASVVAALASTTALARGASRSMPRRAFAGAVIVLGAVVAIVAANALRDPGSSPNGGVLTQKPGAAGCVRERTAAGDCAAGDGLIGAGAVAFSPDGRSVYLAAFDSGRVAAFARAAGGALHAVRGTASGGLQRPESVAVSPDGHHVYVASSGESSVSVFRRESDGELRSVGCVSAEDTGGRCVRGAALKGADAVAISPGGEHVYVAASASNAVAVFRREPGSGELRQEEGPQACIAESDPGDECADGHALATPEALSVSPEGDNVYVASIDDAVAVLHRDARTGRLTQSAGRGGCISKHAIDGCTPARAFGLGSDGSGTVAVSPDGRSVYVAAAESNAVAVLDRGRRGELTQKSGSAGCIARGGAEGCAAGAALLQPASVAVSADRRSVYVASSGSDAVVTFDRDLGDGTLRATAGGCVTERAAPRRCAAGRALDGALSLTTSPDDRSLYVASYESNAIAVFDRR